MIDLLTEVVERLKISLPVKDTELAKEIGKAIEVGFKMNIPVNEIVFRINQYRKENNK